MLSGIGDQAELRRLGLPVVQHLPGVGQNLKDHSAVGCVWEYQQPLATRNNGGEATFFWKSKPDLDTPDLQTCQVEGPLCSAETRAKFNPPVASWTMYGGVVRPKKSRPDSLDRTQSRRPYTDRRQYAVPPRRPEGRGSVRGTLSRDWQFGFNPSPNAKSCLAT